MTTRQWLTAVLLLLSGPLLVAAATALIVLVGRLGLARTHVEVDFTVLMTVVYGGAGLFHAVRYVRYHRRRTCQSEHGAGGHPRV